MNAELLEEKVFPIIKKFNEKLREKDETIEKLKKQIDAKDGILLTLIPPAPDFSKDPLPSENLTTFEPKASEVKEKPPLERKPIQVSTSYSKGDRCPCRQFETDDYPFVCEICRRELYSVEKKAVHVCPDFDICVECADHVRAGNSQFAFPLLYTRYSPWCTDSCACVRATGVYEEGIFTCDECGKSGDDHEGKTMHFCPNFDLCVDCFRRRDQLISLDQKYYCSSFSPYD